jgi:formylglycine-generating enzyme required for sulfatase activity
MSDIFLCYSKQDIDTAQRLVQLFETEGWRVFIDKKTQVGHRWHKVIENELHTAKAVVVLWSATSRDSDFVLEEAEYGKRKNILFPAFIEAVEYPYGFGRIQTADLAGWTHPQEHDGLTQLLDSLRAHLNGDVLQSPSESPPVIVSPSPAPGQTFRDTLRLGGEGPLMAVISAGRFMMGSFENEPERRDNEGPQHAVIIAQSFALGVYAVTFAEYDRFCQETGRKKSDDEDWKRENRPVINVSWHDAQAYCAWLCDQTGQSYRLPSESEWEYACRAGTVTPFNTGDTINSYQVNFGVTHKKTLPVGSFPPNKFGLYDMHGNVWEWTQDCWHKDYQNAPGDGSAWLEQDGGDCNRRVVRGGSWDYNPLDLRSASRNRFFTDNTFIFLGFRIARAL